MSQMLYPLFGAYAADTSFALMIPGPPGIYEGLNPSITGSGGSSGWTVSLSAGAWKTAGDPAGTSLATSKGRFLIREDAPVSVNIAGPSATDRIDLVIGSHLYTTGPLDSTKNPPQPTGVYSSAQRATYTVVQGSPAASGASPVVPTVADPYLPDGHRAVVLAQIYVPASGNPTATQFAANIMRFEEFSAIMAEVIAAREGNTNLKAKLDSISLTPGAQGQPGQAASVSIGNVTMGAAGSEPVVANSGTPTAAVLNFTLPTGPPGPQGSQGAQGAQGQNGTNGQDATCPTGSIFPFAGMATPSGYLMCDGSAVSRTQYSALFAVLQTVYGAGDGSTTFNLPNMQGLFPVGVAKGQAVGATGGEAQHTLKSNELPSHAHAFPGDEQLAYAPSPYVPSVLAPFNYDAMSKLAGVGNIYETVEFQPRGDAHNNLPPFIALNFIIKT